jgi:hypothetical protein
MGDEDVESIWGKHAVQIDADALARRLAGCDAVALDLGTGDGRYVRHLAQTQPTWFVVGIDACRENLHQCSRTAPANALYLIANALALPRELDGLATRLTINFPWGSLLLGLLDEATGFPERLAALAQPGALIEVRLNAGALAEVGWPLDAGAARIRRALGAAGFDVRPPVALGPMELRACPTTWARRLAFGRDPRAVELRGCRADV